MIGQWYPLQDTIYVYTIYPGYTHYVNGVENVKIAYMAYIKIASLTTFETPYKESIQVQPSFNRLSSLIKWKWQKWLHLNVQPSSQNFNTNCMMWLYNITLGVSFLRALNFVNRPKLWVLRNKSHEMIVKFTDKIHNRSTFWWNWFYFFLKNDIYNAALWY